MEVNMTYKDEKYPPDLVIPGNLIKYMNVGIEQFYILIKNQFDIDNYEILISEYNEENYVTLSFVPRITPTFKESEFFEIPDQGIYKNGPGVTYFISKEDMKILKTTYMR